MASKIPSLPKNVLPGTVLLDHRILNLRGQKVILDADLATLYGVSTKRLNEQVKRNADRFPADFMFQLSRQEKAEVVANCDHLSRLKFSPSLPNAFTEHGALMAANLLNSRHAVAMSVYVIRAFVKMREHQFGACWKSELRTHLPRYESCGIWRLSRN